MKRRGQKRQERKARRFIYSCVGPTRIYRKLCSWVNPWHLDEFANYYGRSRLFMQQWITLSLRWKREGK